MKRILVTGATETIGFEIVNSLVGKYVVYAMGRNFEKGKKLEQMGASFICADFTEELKDEYFKNIDFVIHAGGIHSNSTNWNELFRTNVEGTRVIADMCIKNNVKKLIYISSSFVYREKRDLFDVKEDDFNIDNEFDDYTKTKIMSEALLQDCIRRGLNVTIIRTNPVVTFDNNCIATNILDIIRKWNRIPVVRNGEVLLEFTCAKNLVYAIEKCLEKDYLNGEIFNISDEHTIKYKDLIMLISKKYKITLKVYNVMFALHHSISEAISYIYKKINLKIDPMFNPQIIKIISFSLTLDITKAKSVLDYRPLITIEDLIEK